MRRDGVVDFRNISQTKSFSFPDTPFRRLSLDCEIYRGSFESFCWQKPKTFFMFCCILSQRKRTPKPERLHHRKLETTFEMRVSAIGHKKQRKKSLERLERNTAQTGPPLFHLRRFLIGQHDEVGMHRCYMTWETIIPGFSSVKDKLSREFDSPLDFTFHHAL